MSAETLDLRFRGERQAIASYLVQTRGRGFVLIECGPESTLAALERGVRDAGHEMDDLRAVLVTHVHLDHAGAAGELSHRYHVPVFVHPAGAPHLEDPRRLLRSAGRLYGDEMGELWGGMRPVARDLLRGIGHDERIVVDGLSIRAIHTPGHARHHVAWEVGGAVATGDVGGIRIPGHECVVPPTPPPDIDLAAWKSSLERLATCEAEQLLLTHFGAFDDTARHLTELGGHLARWARLAREIADGGEGRAELLRRLEAWEREVVLARVDDAGALRRYRLMCPMPMNAAGLARWAERIGEGDRV